MVPLLPQIAGLILLELEAIDHYRRRSARGGIRPGCRRIGIGVTGYQGQPFAVRCPGILGHTTWQVGSPLSFASLSIKQPDLLSLMRVIPIGEERQVPAIGAP